MKPVYGRSETYRWKLSDEDVNFLTDLTGRGTAQTQFLFQLVGGNFEKLKRLETQMKNCFIAGCPDTVEDVERILALRPTFNKYNMGMRQPDEAEQAYIDRPIEEDGLAWEEFKKIFDLRNIKLWEAKYKRTPVDKPKPTPFEIGDKVYFRISRITNPDAKYYASVSERVGGVVIKVHKDNRCDVSSALGIFKNKQCGIRRVDDFSSVEIPERIQKMGTARMLKAFKNSMVHTYYSSGHRQIFLEGSYYDPDVIQAELNKREHIYSKQDKKFIKQQKKHNG